MNFPQSIGMVDNVQPLADESSVCQNEPRQKDRADHECELDGICTLKHGSS
jgi:hypothetical protein